MKIYAMAFGALAIVLLIAMPTILHDWRTRRERERMRRADEFIRKMAVGGEKRP